MQQHKREMGARIEALLTKTRVPVSYGEVLRALLFSETTFEM